MAKDISPSPDEIYSEKPAFLRAAKVSVSGAVIQIEPDDFAGILARINNPIVVKSFSGRISKTYRYLTSYKGFTFCTRSRESLLLPNDVEVIETRKLYSPV